jgi:hypothetical protein
LFCFGKKEKNNISVLISVQLICALSKNSILIKKHLKNQKRNLDDISPVKNGPNSFIELRSELKSEAESESENSLENRLTAQEMSTLENNLKDMFLAQLNGRKKVLHYDKILEKIHKRWKTLRCRFHPRQGNILRLHKR